MRLDGVEELAQEQARAREERAGQMNGAEEPEESPALKSVTIEELLAMEVPARECLLGPWLREKETAMIHAWRGIGKTQVGLNIAVAVASGGSFLGWTAPRSRRVLYLDGEMPVPSLQERLAAIIKASPSEETLDPENLRFVCADLQDGAPLNLTTGEGQAALDPLIEPVDLVVVDSISTLAIGGPENEAESWLPMQAWALRLRRQGKTVLLFHHDGKGGAQRGTSRREDILDVVIGLRRPADYNPTEGARFEVHFEKLRALCGDAAAPFEAALRIDDGCATWTTRTVDDVQLARATALFEDGLKVHEVMKELGISRATVYRLKKKAADR